MMNLVQLQERLRDVPMQALMQYANGANPQIPPFLALGELNRRKKMQESAAADQAQEMEGAPTVKQQIEQAAGLMALQGSRQRQAAQQQQGIQAAMPMAAPNTTTSEPAQLAGGGFIDDIVVPRDFQGGGMAMNPDMMRKLMMLQAMKKRQGIAGLPANNIRRADYAGGGIVAFKAGDIVPSADGSAADVINAAVDQAEGAPAGNMTEEQRRMYELIRRLQAVRSIQDRKREAGIEEPPDDRAERLKAVEAEKQRFEDADTVTRRILALKPLQLGASMSDYLGKRETTQSDIERRMAEIKDLKAKAAYDAKMGNIKDARAEEIEAITKEQSLLKDIGDAGYKSALRAQAEAGRTSEADRAAQAYLRAKKADGDKRPDDVILNEGYINYVRERGAAFQRANIYGEATDVGTEDKARNNVDARLKDVKSAEFRELNKRIAADRKNGTNTAQEYKNELYRNEAAALRRQPAPSRPTGGGGTPALPPGFEIVK